MSEAEQRVQSPSIIKREEILKAARTLFLKNGFDRTSMDQIAMLAKVSKRTIYDYFGGKVELLTVVINTALEALLDALQYRLDVHLPTNNKIQRLEALEDALVGFATDMATSVIGSSDYPTVFALTTGLRPEISQLDSYVHSTAPEKIIAERLQHFGEKGLLDIPDPLEAANHLNALTVLLAYSNYPDPSKEDNKLIRKSIAGGVRVFIRAYGTNRGS